MVEQAASCENDNGTAMTTMSKLHKGFTEKEYNVAAIEKKTCAEQGFKCTSAEVKADRKAEIGEMTLERGLQLNQDLEGLGISVKCQGNTTTTTTAEVSGKEDHETKGKKVEEGKDGKKGKKKDEKEDEKDDEKDDEKVDEEEESNDAHVDSLEMDELGSMGSH